MVVTKQAHVNISEGVRFHAHFNLSSGTLQLFVTECTLNKRFQVLPTTGRVDQRSNNDKSSGVYSHPQLVPDQVRKLAILRFLQPSGADEPGTAKK